MAICPIKVRSEKKLFNNCGNASEKISTPAMANASIWTCSNEIAVMFPSPTSFGVSPLPHGTEQTISKMPAPSQKIRSKAAKMIAAIPELSLAYRA